MLCGIPGIKKKRCFLILSSPFSPPVFLYLSCLGIPLPLQIKNMLWGFGGLKNHFCASFIIPSPPSSFHMVPLRPPLSFFKIRGVMLV